MKTVGYFCFSLVDYRFKPLLKGAMKIIILLLTLFSVTSYGKTCTASLHGNLKKDSFFFPFTKVFYPDDTVKSRPAKWEGEVVTKSFISPSPVEITCGSPYLMTSFDKFRATGMLPQIVETYPWTVIDWSGNPREVEPEKLYGFGDSYEYPYPATFFEGTSTIDINEPAPAGIKDICDVPKLDLTLPVKAYAKIQPDASAAYLGGSIWGNYSWDPTSTPTGETVELELEDAYVNITCASHWEYKASFYWPYFVSEDNDSMCGAGEVHRRMELEGHLYMTEDNKVFGYIKVEKPTVTFSGSIKGDYTGSGFSIPIEGSFITDSSGKKVVLLPILEGGDGISWHYTLMCPYGNISNNLFGAVTHYLRIMMEQEELSSEEGGFFKLSAEGDEKTVMVDMGGQGTVTITRSLKKKE